MIEKTKWDNGTIHTELVACPVCETEFESPRNRTKHFLDEHDTDDFGLNKYE
jgi:hypothetical protein